MKKKIDTIFQTTGSFFTYFFDNLILFCLMGFLVFILISSLKIFE